MEDTALSLICTRKLDHLLVNPLDHSQVELFMKKFTWNKYSLYDLNLYSISPAKF